MASSRYSWIEPYSAIAHAIYKLKDDRQRLFEIFESIFKGNDDLPFPFSARGEELSTIDPFTFFSSFNRGLIPYKRQRIVELAAEKLGLSVKIPELSYEGIPTAHLLKSWFFAAKNDRDPHDIDNLWDLFCAALEYADDSSSALLRQKFVDKYDVAIGQRQVKWNITMGLFWIAPKIFMPLDGNSRKYLAGELNINVGKTVPDGNKYLEIIDLIKKTTAKPLYQLSAEAFEWNPKNEDGWYPSLNYYDPGIDVDLWKKLLNDSEVCDESSRILLKRLLDYGKPATCTQLSVKYGEAKNYYVTAAVNLAKRIQNVVHCSLCDEKWWPILFIGQEAAKEDQGSYRWKLRDELKEALVDFDFGTTPLYASEKAPDNSASCKDELVSMTFSYENYSDDSFLNEVYIDEAELQTMRSLLRRKKNLILQGAPGTGKTFAAKRLAYTMMGLKDTSRIQLVQFHQSSTYEDFIYGYRPNGEGGFEPQPGVFMRFCQRASKDLDNEYFFIIDEINRANISKVFGELLMLIEADHRGESVELGIDGQRFSVPPNLYLIGMMNTADRGLALIDYALRRRFAFFEMKPALDNPTFLSMVADTNNKRLTSLINCVRNLNIEIAKDPALGRGFCIGHSYFCTNDDGAVSDENVFEIVEYELKPLLEEYWFDDPDKVEAEMDKIEKAIRS